jgi:Cysteine rich repeat
MRQFIQKTSFGSFLWLALTVAGNVHAQTAAADKVGERLESAVQKLRAACSDDLAKYCSSVTPGEGRLLYCMIAHEDKISTKCDYALYSAARNLDRAIDFVEEAAEACWTDIQKLCADVPEGGGHVAQCLMSKKSTTSADCQKILEKIPTTK